jgi:hypothetical protein
VADTSEYFIVDGDFELAIRFDPGAQQPLDSGVAMRVWAAVNAVNGLVYGYGGLKLCRKDAIRELGSSVDVLAAIPGRTEFVSDLAGRTRFNQSPLHAWKAGFRECAMLCRGSEFGMSELEARRRVAVWLDPSSCRGRYSGWALTGARDGVRLASTLAVDSFDWEVLNDPVLLSQWFSRCMACSGWECSWGADMWRGFRYRLLGRSTRLRDEFRG